MPSYEIRQTITVEAVFTVVAAEMPDRDDCHNLLTRVTLEEYDTPEGIDVLTFAVESADICEAYAEELSEAVTQ